jgi:hypothetical protein
MEQITLSTLNNYITTHKVIRGYNSREALQVKVLDDNSEPVNFEHAYMYVKYRQADNNEQVVVEAETIGDGIYVVNWDDKLTMHSGYPDQAKIMFASVGGLTVAADVLANQLADTNEISYYVSMAIPDVFNGATGPAGDVEWTDVLDKPFETLGSEFSVTDGELHVDDVGTTNYDDLDNKPKINQETIEGSHAASYYNLQDLLVAGSNINIDPTTNVISATGEIAQDVHWEDLLGDPEDNVKMNTLIKQLEQDITDGILTTHKYLDGELSTDIWTSGQYMFADYVKINDLVGDANGTIGLALSTNGKSGQGYVTVLTITKVGSSAPAHDDTKVDKYSSGIFSREANIKNEGGIIDIATNDDDERADTHVHLEDGVVDIKGYTVTVNGEIIKVAQGAFYLAPPDKLPAEVNGDYTYIPGLDMQMGDTVYDSEGTLATVYDINRQTGRVYLKTVTLAGGDTPTGHDATKVDVESSYASNNAYAKITNDEGTLDLQASSNTGDVNMMLRDGDFTINAEGEATLNGHDIKIGQGAFEMKSPDKLPTTINEEYTYIPGIAMQKGDLVYDSVGTVGTVYDFNKATGRVYLRTITQVGAGGGGGGATPEQWVTDQRLTQRYGELNDNVTVTWSTGESDRKPLVGDLVFSINGNIGVITSLIDGEPFHVDVKTIAITAINTVGKGSDPMFLGTFKEAEAPSNFDNMTNMYYNVAETAMQYLVSAESVKDGDEDGMFNKRKLYQLILPTNVSGQTQPQITSQSFIFHTQGNDGVINELPLRIGSSDGIVTNLQAYSYGDNQWHTMLELQKGLAPIKGAGFIATATHGMQWGWNPTAGSLYGTLTCLTEYNAVVTATDWTNLRQEFDDFGLTTEVLYYSFNDNVGVPVVQGFDFRQERFTGILTEGQQQALELLMQQLQEGTETHDDWRSTYAPSGDLFGGGVIKLSDLVGDLTDSGSHKIAKGDTLYFENGRTAVVTSFDPTKNNPIAFTLTNTEAGGVGYKPSTWYAGDPLPTTVGYQDIDRNLVLKTGQAKSIPENGELVYDAQGTVAVVTGNAGSAQYTDVMTITAQGENDKAVWYYVGELPDRLAEDVQFGRGSISLVQTSGTPEEREPELYELVCDQNGVLATIVKIMAGVITAQTITMDRSARTPTLQEVLDAGHTVTNNQWINLYSNAQATDMTYLAPGTIQVANNNDMGTLSGGLMSIDGSSGTIYLNANAPMVEIGTDIKKPFRDALQAMQRPIDLVDGSYVMTINGASTNNVSWVPFANDTPVGVTWTWGNPSEATLYKGGAFIEARNGIVTGTFNVQCSINGGTMPGSIVLGTLDPAFAPKMNSGHAFPVREIINTLNQSYVSEFKAFLEINSSGQVVLVPNGVTGTFIELSATVMWNNLTRPS